jgi:repressor LexA
MTQPPTPTQLRVLEVVQAHIEATGWPPSMREIAQAIDRSPTAASQSLAALERGGFVRTLGRKARAIQVTDTGREALAQKGAP